MAKLRLVMNEDPRDSHRKHKDPWRDRLPAVPWSHTPQKIMDEEYKTTVHKRKEESGEVPETGLSKGTVFLIVLGVIIIFWLIF